MPELNRLCKKVENDWQSINERMRMGYESYKNDCIAKGIKIGRPSTYKKDVETYKKQYAEEIKMLNEKIPLRTISMITGRGTATLQKLKKMFC